MKVMVVLTIFNDKRVFRTLVSLFNQSRSPDIILLADGGSSDSFQESLKVFDGKYSNVVFDVLPGNIAETRYKAVDKYIDNIDVFAFIDSDEVAPVDWLKNLVDPIETGEADFTGGFTKAYDEPKSKSECYMYVRDKCFFETVASDVTLLPMGNSAWKAEVFKEIGNFDTFTKKYGISEDYDLNIRAVKNGFRGLLVEDAWCWHDRSHYNTFYKLFKAIYLRQVRAGVAYLKHGMSMDKMTYEARKVQIIHPFQLILVFSRFFAYLSAWSEFNWGKKNGFY